MRKILLVLIVLLCLAMPAMAEVPEEAAALLNAAHPGASMTLVGEDSRTVIAVMSQGESHTLCIAEKISTEWTLTVDNPTALRPGALPSFLYEGGMSLFYTYHPVQRDDEVYSDRYHAVRTENGWSDVDFISIHQTTNQEISFAWHGDGLLHASCVRYDENGNQQGEIIVYPPCSPSALAGKTRLADFDINLFPVSLDLAFLKEAAAVLCPGYTVVDGVIRQDTMQFIADKPDGTRVFIGCRHQFDNSWAVTESSPLWPGTTCDTFHSARGQLLLTPPGEGESYVNVALERDNQWKVNFIGRKDWFTFTGYEIRDENGKTFYGRTLPTHAVQMMDWAALPSTVEEAVAMQQAFDSGEWALVNNPDPADRLHLRERPSRDARSLGKYYNGTPVSIQAEEGDWVRVHVCGHTGWMMKKYLAFGEKMDKVVSAMPIMYTVEGCDAALTDWHGVPLAPNMEGATVIVLGIVEGKKYHVTIPGESVSGWMEWGSLTPGNG